MPVPSGIKEHLPDYFKIDYFKISLWRMNMRNVRVIAMLMVLSVVSACGNNDFHAAYSSTDLGGVPPIGLDD
jgi:hypothetical protein